jgi:tRNA nucleotidyltransferase (CCA-adding enzyme)
MSENHSQNPAAAADDRGDRLPELDLAAIPADVLGVCTRLRAGGFQAHLVGGGVRDLLLGRQPNDFDVATDAHPPQVMSLFGARYAIPTGLQHGTVTVVTGGAEGGEKRHVEVTTFRGEGAYLDGRRPTSVSFVGSLDEDLSRRDFTMNAIAFDPIAVVLTDPFDGRGDLARRTVRAVGDALTRFREDGLRPLRAVRQAAQLGFQIAPDTLAAIPLALDVVRKVSAERVRDEMLKLLGAPRPSVGIELMRASGLLGEVLPELLESVGVTQNRFHKHDVYSHTLAVVDETTGDPMTRLGALLHDIGKPRARQPREGAPGEYSFFKHEYVGAAMAEAICQRWKLSNAERERVVALVAQHMFFYTPDWTDGTVRRFVRKVGADLVPALFAIREGDIAGRGFGEDPEVELGELRRRIAAVAAEDAALGVGDLAIDGRDVMRILGIAPSRRVGELLEQLVERVLDQPTLNNPGDLEGLLRVLAAAPPASASDAGSGVVNAAGPPGTRPTSS